MRFFALSFDKVLIRFFLMMTCVIVGLFVGQPLLALVALPLFLSALLGISFMPEPAAQHSAEVKTMEKVHATRSEAA